MALTWEQARVIIAIWSGCWSYPASINPVEVSHYNRLQHEILFNASNGINRDYNELAKDSAHRIIAGAMERGTKC